MQEFPDFGEGAFASERSAAEPPDGPAGRMPGWAIGASLACHLGLAAVLLLRPAYPPPIVPPVDAVAVDILTSAQFDALVGPKAAPPEPNDNAVLPSPSEEKARPSSPSAPEPSTEIRPTEMLSARDLASPKSRQAVAAMKTMSDPDRIDQLCAIEASAQIHAWRGEFEPERLVSFAMADTRMDGNILVAEGAAFRSRRNWYRLHFRCGLVPDHTRVASFEFQVGGAVPREQWEEWNLAAVH